MTVNERIRTFRKDTLHMNQRQFASDLGMAQTGISSMEQDGATITDRVIKSICLAYSLNENWLRTGNEPMYLQPDSFSLDDFVKSKGMTDFELEIVKTYFEIEPDIRKKLVNHFRSKLAASAVYSDEDDVPDTPEELERRFPPVELDEQNEVG